MHMVGTVFASLSVSVTFVSREEQCRSQPMFFGMHNVESKI